MKYRVWKDGEAQRSGSTVEADTAYLAVMEWVEEYDNFNYEIAKGSPVQAVVKDESGCESVWSVSGKMEVEYEAAKIRGDMADDPFADFADIRELPDGSLFIDGAVVLWPKTGFPKCHHARPCRAALAERIQADNDIQFGRQVETAILPEIQPVFAAVMADQEWSEEKVTEVHGIPLKSWRLACVLRLCGAGEIGVASLRYDFPAVVLDGPSARALVMGVRP